MANPTPVTEQTHNSALSQLNTWNRAFFKPEIPAMVGKWYAQMLKIGPRVERLIRAYGTYGKHAGDNAREVVQAIPEPV